MRTVRVAPWPSVHPCVYLTRNLTTTCCLYAAPLCPALPVSPALPCPALPCPALPALHTRVQEFHKQALVDALLRLGGASEVEAAQAKSDKMIEVYCDQGFA